jgi:hypothetical protein
LRCELLVDGDIENQNASERSHWRLAFPNADERAIDTSASRPHGTQMPASARQAHVLLGTAARVAMKRAFDDPTTIDEADASCMARTHFKHQASASPQTHVRETASQ